MTQDQVQGIMNAVAQIKSQVDSNSQLAALLETNPYQALVDSGAPISWPADVVDNFNAGVVSNSTLFITVGGQKRSRPDSLACYFCWFGLQVVMVAAVVAAGIALTSGIGFAIGILAATVAEAVGVSVTTITLLAGTVGGVSLTKGHPKLLRLV